MASFPNAVKSFASRSNGQVIDAAHVGDLQDEVNAIEDGYLNGTARLNSSHSTVVALSVSGGSTLTGNVTMGGDLTVTGTITGGHVVPTVRLTHSADQALAHATFTGLSWDTETFDVGGQHSTASNSSRITFADSTGKYAVGANVEFATVSTGHRIARLMLSDATPVGSASMWLPTAASAQLTVSALVRVASTTVFATVQAYQDSGGSTGSISAGATYGTSFWAYKVSS